MKKLLSLMLALALFGGLTGCAQAETVKIVLWHSMSEQAGTLMEQYVRDFNATVGAERGIQVEAVFQGTYAEAVTKMNSMLMSGQQDALPDVIQLDATGKVPYRAAENAYTVDRALADHPGETLEGILAPALANWNLGGTQLGLPFATSTTVTYYNKTVLDAAGLDAPATLADIGGMAWLAADGVKVYACVPNTPTLANWLGQLGSDLVNAHNGSEDTATALACIENGALADFLTAWKALYATGALANQNASTDEFVAGRQLIMTSSSSSVASILARVDGAFELGVCGYPKVREDASAGARTTSSTVPPPPTVWVPSTGSSTTAGPWHHGLPLTTSATGKLCITASRIYIPVNMQPSNQAIKNLLSGNNITVFIQKTATIPSLNTPSTRKWTTGF